MDTVWKTNGVKRVDCCPYCTLAFCSVISISTQGLITPLHYTMSGAPGSRLRHAPFDWLRLGFSAQPHPKGLTGKQEEGQPLEPETAHIIPDSISNFPPQPVLYPSGGWTLLHVCLQMKLTLVTWRNHWVIHARTGLFVQFGFMFQIQLCFWRVEVSIVREAGLVCLKRRKIFLRYIYKVKNISLLNTRWRCQCFTNFFCYFFLQTFRRP